MRITPVAILALALATPSMAEDTTVKTEDTYLWLEEVEGEKALGFVEGMNAVSLPRLEAHADFASNRQFVLDQLNAKDRITYARFRGDYVYNFWQDETNIRGLIRRMPVADYVAGKSTWEPVLDIDQLAKDEDANWVYKGTSCLMPKQTRCMISLSPGGSDASEIREFDLEAKSFVEGGFRVAAAKTWFDWADEDTLIVGSDFGEGSQTESGYPRTQRLWKRGTKLEDAQEIAATDKTHMGLAAVVAHEGDKRRQYILDLITFWTSEANVLLDDGTQVRVPFPLDANQDHAGVDLALARMRSDWKIEGKLIAPAGSLVALDMADVASGGDGNPQVVFAPNAQQSIDEVTVSNGVIYIALLDNVSGSLLRFERGDNGWSQEKVALPPGGSIRLIDADETQDQVFVEFESFTQPPTLYHVAGKTVTAVQSLPARFDADSYEAVQYFAPSADGTKVPYFLVRQKGAKNDGETPVWLYGYGGFEIALTPNYLAPKYQLWLKQGGAFVVANIRGGGEFGPKWHQAALLENRLRAYEDFAAISDHLVATGVTKSKKIGVVGGSNGGLLTGVMLTRYPEKIGAAIVAVPLIDMIRYDKLLAGASWVGEYGDPDDAEMRDYIMKYSPYQNVREDAGYPVPFIYTSTKDDRVHPGHARKFAAKLAEHGYPLYYYENTEGGHAGAANQGQRAYVDALSLSYMTQMLMKE